jgi:hypothetical protein
MQKDILKRLTQTQKAHNKNLMVMGLLVIAIMLVMVACSEKGNSSKVKDSFPPPLSNKPDITLMFPPEGTEFDDNLIVILPVANLSSSNTQLNQNAISLKHFIPEGMAGIMGIMHTYRIVASDGWNPHKDRGQPDLNWTDFIKGFYLPSFHRTYFHDFSQDLNFAYNVKRVQEIQAYRTITVVKADSEEVLFQVNILDIEDMINPQNGDNIEKAFKLNSLITKYITDTPQNYEYFITAADYTGGSQGAATLNWHFLQGAYYSLDIDRVFFPVLEGHTGNMRLRNLIKIELRKPQSS